MGPNRLRIGAALASLAILVAACSSSTPTASPAGSVPAVASPSAATPAAPVATPAPAPTEPASPSAVAPATPTPGAGAPATVPPGGPVTVRWFCCLGTGEDKSQQPVEKQVVADFNATHPNIHLEFDLTPYTGARDALSTQIASGNGPDIVGPVGVGGTEAFHGLWLDLAPYIAKYGYDLSQFSQGAVDFYKMDPAEGQTALPFAIYPSELYYQKAMFAEAGLNEPPHAYGAQYTLPDGSVVDWNYDTLRQIAMILTVDKNGKDATQPGFDPKQIVQYGFEPQRDDLRGMGAYFGAGKLLAADGKTVEIPAAWAAGWKWVYDGIWKDHFIEPNAIYQSPEWNGGGYTFNTGKVAMQENFLWNICCVTDAGRDWDIAAIPAWNGTTTAVFNADTFRILKSSKHPDEAFQVLEYLLGDASAKLLNAYSGFPARASDQAGFFAQLSQQKTDTGKPVYPIHVDWQVATDGVQYADNPNFEAYMPAYNQSLDTLNKYLTKWTSTAGLNMDQEIAQLQAELQGIWDKSR